MKIWYKKTFTWGMIFGILAVALLAIGFLKGFELKNTVLMVLCAIIGLGFVVRSLSYEQSRQDRLDDLDERNRLIALKSKSKSFTVTQISCEILMMLFLGVGAALAHQQILAVGVGLAFCFVISLFTELFTKLYYEKCN